MGFGNDDAGAAGLRNQKSVEELSGSSLEDLQKQLRDAEENQKKYVGDETAYANYDDYKANIKKAMEIAQRRNQLQQYQAGANQVAGQYEDWANQLANRDTLKQEFEIAKNRARGTLASEYAARGLSGTGAYDTAMANAAADLSLRETQMYEQRMQQANQLRGNALAVRQGSYETGEAAAKYREQFNTAQTQYFQNLKMQQDQIAEQQMKDTFSGIGGIMAGGAKIGMAYYGAQNTAAQTKAIQDQTALMKANWGSASPSSVAPVYNQTTMPASSGFSSPTFGSAQIYSPTTKPTLY